MRSWRRMFSMFFIVHVGRVDAALDRRVLGGQAEGVEADREEDVVAVHAPEAGDARRSAS